jgi:hypothetical protein
MGSEFFEVSVAARKDAIVRLDVVECHPDAGGIPADRSFALKMLLGAAGDGDPIRQEISFKDASDREWLKGGDPLWMQNDRVTGIQGSARAPFDRTAGNVLRG